MGLPASSQVEYPQWVTSPSRRPPAGQINPRSLGLGLSAYIIWGFFPLYFQALKPAGAFEVIVHRAFWGFLAAMITIWVFSRKTLLVRLLRDREAMARLAIAGILVVINWTVYIYAVLTDRTVDAALGYFINPLVTVALAWLVLKERITRVQQSAIALGALAVVIMIAGMGSLPWISLALAFSFGFYTLVKKNVAGRVPPLEGLAVETATVTPLLLGYYAYLLATKTTSFHALTELGEPGTWQWVPHLLLLIGAGILTMIPLLLFAGAAKGLPLAVLGLIQYITPVFQLVIGVAIFHEHMSPVRWVATGIIWVALSILSVDWINQIRQARAAN